MNNKLLSLDTEKLNKYNLNFGHDGIHFFTSEKTKELIPIHVNLYRLDSFFENLKGELFSHIVRNLQTKKDFSVTKEEYENLGKAVADYLNHFRVDVGLNLTHNYNITYASSGDDIHGAAADERFIVDPYNTCLINKPNELLMDGTGIYAPYNMKSNSISILDEAYNNYI
jgi:Holliday junction resolvase RusA-like endonuclease